MADVILLYRSSYGLIVYNLNTMASDSEFALGDTMEGRWLQEEHEKFLVGKFVLSQV